MCKINCHQGECFVSHSDCYIVIIEYLYLCIYSVNILTLIRVFKNKILWTKNLIQTCIIISGVISITGDRLGCYLEYRIYARFAKLQTLDLKNIGQNEPF